MLHRYILGGRRYSEYPVAMLTGISGGDVFGISGGDAAGINPAVTFSEYPVAMLQV